MYSSSSSDAIQITLLPPPPPGSHHNQPSGSGYRNPWPSFRSPACKDIWDALTKGAVLKSPPEDGDQECWERNGRLVRVREPCWADAIDEHGSGKRKGKDKGKGKVCWLGHAGVFLQVAFPRSSSPTGTTTTSNHGGSSLEGEASGTGEEMVGILFDPIFSQRCSPTQHIGPSRYLAAPCPVSALPAVHVVCISHDHYDHLDYGTIMDLFTMNPDIHFFVPLGVKQWFLSSHIPENQVTEMDWHQRARVIIPFPSPSTARRQRRRRRQQRHSRQKADRQRQGMRKNGSAGWYRADQSAYRDFSSSEAEEDDELAQGGGGGGGYPPRPPRGGLKNRTLGTRKRDQRMRAMPGAFVAVGGEGSDSEDLESGGAVSVGDTSGSDAGLESASDSEGGQGSSVGGGRVQEEEEQGTLPLLRNTVPPPRSRRLRPHSGPANPSIGGQSTLSDVTAAVGQPRRRGRPVRLEIVCTPAQHRSGRGLLDQMSTLWASWVVRVIDDDGSDDDDDGGGDAGEEISNSGNQMFDGRGQGGVGNVTPEPSGADDVWEKAKGWTVFFGGDTGFRYAGAPDGERDMYICPAFQDIAHRYGPMDLCLLPISTGSSLSFLRNIFGLSLHHYSLTSAQHSNAWDAIQIAKLMQAKRTVAIHHSTFSPEDEARGCVYEFVNTAKEEGVPQDWEEDGCFVVADIGQVLEIP